MSGIQEGTTAYNRAALALFFAGFVIFSILYTVQPLMPSLTNAFNVAPSRASMSLSVSTATLAIGLLLAVPLASRFGRKTLMTASLIATTCLSLMSAFAPTFTWFLVLRGLIGFFLAGVPAMAMAYIAEEFHKDGIGKMMGLYIAGNSIGGMGGRLIAGSIGDFFDWRIAIVVISLVAAAGTILFMTMLAPPQRKQTELFSIARTTRKYLNALKQKRLMLLVSLGFLLMGSFVTIYNYIGFYLMDPPFSFSQTVVSFLFISYLAGTFSSVYMGKKADQYGKSRILLISVLIMGAGAWLTVLPYGVIQLPALLILTFGFFASHSIASNSVSTLAGKFRAEAASLYLVSYYLGSSVAGTVGGLFYDFYGWLGILIFISVLLLCVFPVIVVAKLEKPSETS